MDASDSTLVLAKLALATPHRYKADTLKLAAEIVAEKIAPCPHSDGNACEQYRLQGQRCQDCPLLAFPHRAK